MTAESLACAHCGTLVERRAALWLQEKPYCCDGCRTVARIVEEGGWDEFYRRRDGFSPRPDDAPEATQAFDTTAWRDANVRDLGEGVSECDVQVGGLRCAACTWLVERALKATPGVEDAQVSYATGRARIRWRDGVRLSELARRVSMLGYRMLSANERAPFDRDLIAQFGVSVFVAMNVMTLSLAVYFGWFDTMEERHAALFRWASLVIVTPAVMWSSQPFFDGAINGLRHRMLSMDFPIALAIAVLYGHGLVETFRGFDAYLDSLAMLIALLLGGRLAEASGRARAEAAAQSVLGSLPTTARRVTADGVEEVPVADLVVGDRVLVAQGSAVPTDARVTSGAAQVDLSLLTGESEPVAASPGTELPAGALVRDGSIELVTTAVGEATLLARMARRVADARSGRIPELRWNDRIAPWFTLATLVVATATFVGWTIAGGIGAAFTPTIAVLVVACPCALALATPSALAAGIAAAARRGAWIRDAGVLLRLARVDQVLVDKTGTVTEGAMRVTDASDETLRWAVALERFSTHPVARAILDEATSRRIPLPAADFVHETVGVGIEGTVDGHAVCVRASGAGSVIVEVDGQRCGEIALRDRIRDDSARAIRDLGVPVSLLSGDAQSTVSRIAEAAGIGEATGGMTPEGKASRVERERAEGRTVLFAGDGLNDAPALAAADVGVAMATGSAATVLASDVVVLTPSLMPVAAALRAGRVTAATLRWLTRISMTYNLSAVTAAAFGLVNPLIAAILMPLSSATVIIGALTIERRMRRGHHPVPAPDVSGDGVAVRVPLRASRA
jgi:Cu2+-exporting ATPase